MSRRHTTTEPLLLPKGAMTSSVKLLPEGQCYTDDHFCTGDATNAALGKVVLTRSSTSTEPSETVALQDAKPTSILNLEGVQLHTMWRKLGRKSQRRNNKWGKFVRLPELLQQPKGVFLYEFRWNKTVEKEHDWHTICVNCNDRWVCCNETGYIPFGMTTTHETASTHQDLASKFFIADTNSIYALASTSAARGSKGRRLPE